MVYTSDSPACALLETCVHIAADDAPSTFTLLRIIGPDLATEEIAPEQLPANWVGNIPVTQQIGADWLASAGSALLRVPCALVPETANYLLNPLHPDAGLFSIERSYEYPFDLRLKN
jgi:RES domain-containing protein